MAKGPDIPPLAGKPKHQQFTMPTGVLTGIGSRQHSAFSGHPLSEYTLDRFIIQSLLLLDLPPGTVYLNICVILNFQ